MGFENARRLDEIALVELGECASAIVRDVAPGVFHDLRRDPLGLHEVVPMRPWLERDAQPPEQVLPIDLNSRRQIPKDALRVSG